MAVVASQGQQNDPNQQQDPNAQQQPQALAGSAQSGAQPTNSRVAAFSSGSAPNSQGSGRFTNLSKYMDANKGASENLGARTNNNLNRSFNAGQTDVSKQNEQIAQGFQKGRTTLDQGSGYQNQLNEIGQGLNSYKTFEDRGNFDTAGQQAQTLAGDQNYSTLASGQGLDQNALQTSQTGALNSAQNLYNTNQTNLQNIQTNTGRDALLNGVIPKQGYSSGQRNFDKLFLTGNVLNGIQSNLQGKQNTANTLLQGTTGQQKTLDQLVGDENNIVTGLTTAANSNQDLFNTKFGDMKNIEAVNTARNQRYNDLKSALGSGGSISQEDMALLGLDKLGSTFVNENAPTVTGGSNASQKITTPNQQQAAGTGINRIGTYNILKDPAAVNNYITQGANAQNIQDITTQGDYDAYKALQQLALGRDTGMLSGTSKLGGSVNVKGDLAKDIAEKDALFRSTYGDKTYQAAANNYGDEGTSNPFKFSGQGIQNSTETTTPSSLQDFLSGQAAYGGDKIKQYVNVQNTANNLGLSQGGSSEPPVDINTPLYGAAGATAVAQQNFADYLKSGGNINTATQDQYGSGDNIRNLTKGSAASDVKSRLENVLNTEGTRNALDVGADKNYRRFKGLV